MKKSVILLLLVMSPFFIIIHHNNTTPTQQIELQEEWIWMDETKGYPVFVGVDDINGDGYLETIITTSEGFVIFLDKDGNLNQSIRLSEGYFLTTPAFYDIDNDNYDEIVLGCKNGSLYVLNASGEIEWKYNAMIISTSPVIYDINNDNKPEILFTAKGTLYILSWNGTLLVEKQFENSDFVGHIAVDDIDLDDEPEIIIAGTSSKVYAIGSNGLLKWARDLDPAGFVAPVLTNLNPRKTDFMSIILLSRDGTVYALDIDGNIIWTFSSGQIAYDTEFLEASPVISDVDTDGYFEILFGAGTNLYILNSSGRLISSMHSVSKISSIPAVADIDGDKLMDIVYASDFGTLKIVRFNKDEISSKQIGLGSTKVKRQITLADIDADNILEIIFEDTQGRVLAYEYPIQTLDLYYWYTFKGNNQRTGSIKTIDRDFDALIDIVEPTYGMDPNKYDTDGDGISDGWEYYFGLKPDDPSDKDADKDLDGLSNYEEFLYGTYPNTEDSDGDSMSDAWEVKYHLDPKNSTDALLDYDNDTLLNKDEFTYGTDPWNVDTDGDGMPDGWEIKYNLDPTDKADATKDSDGDGLNNLQEYEQGTDPVNPDTDADGLLDGQEVNLGTDPLNADTDGDGLTDGEEVRRNLNPFKKDTDGDLLNDKIDPFPDSVLMPDIIPVFILIGLLAYKYREHLINLFTKEEKEEEEKIEEEVKEEKIEEEKKVSEVSEMLKEILEEE